MSLDRSRSSSFTVCRFPRLAFLVYFTVMLMPCAIMCP